MDDDNEQLRWETEQFMASKEHKIAMAVMDMRSAISDLKTLNHDSHIIEYCDVRELELIQRDLTTLLTCLRSGPLRAVS